MAVALMYGEIWYLRGVIKPKLVARSSAESELRALAQSICEGIWLKRLLEELQIALKDPILIQSDSPAAISITKNTIHNDWTKQIEII